MWRDIEMKSLKTRHLHRVFFGSLLLALFFAWFAPSRALALGTCPAPPFATEGFADPNVLIILDHSGSMGNGPGSQWDDAKSAVINILNTFPGIRFGLMRMDGANYDGLDQISTAAMVRQGGKLLKPCGTPVQEIIDYVNNWGDDSNNPQTWTNLAETLASAGRYFATGTDATGDRIALGPTGLGFYEKGYSYTYNGATYNATLTDDKGQAIDTTSPIQAYCQKSYIIFITDGAANSDNDWSIVTDVIGDYDQDGEAGDCSHSEATCAGGGTYLDDVAKYLHETDLDQTDTEGVVQNLTTYVIGFHTDFPLLERAASQGGGQYYTTSDPNGLINALRGAMGDILADQASGTAVTSVSTSTAAHGQIIRAKFVSGLWSGHLQAFDLPYTAGDTPVWDAGQMLADRQTSRNIFTLLGGGKEDFLSTHAALRASLSGASNWDVAETEAEDIINFIRGDAAHEGGKYRDRDGWPLGDIIHSSAVLVGPPKFPYTEKGYANFRFEHFDRPPVAYVGANDGMLHAFYTADDPAATPAQSKGEEAWAFIPEKLHAKLKQLTENCHQYFVDLPPLVTDVWDQSWDTGNDDGDPGVTVDGWKTLLIGGNRLGGSEYFALDVTDPAANQVSIQWDTVPFPDADRKSSTIPAVGKVLPEDKWVSIITSGFHEGGSTGRIAALKIADGTKASIWHDGTANTNELETQAKGGTKPYYSLTSPVALDSDGDSYLDLIFAGDTEGTLWKFYYDYEAQIWKKVALFTATGQAITGRPTLVFDRVGNLHIYFGTGKYLVEGDKADATRNAFYSLIEQPSQVNGANKGKFINSTPLAKADLIDLTTLDLADEIANLNNAQKDTLTTKGWFFNLDLEPTPAGGDPPPQERVIGSPLALDGVVFFTSFRPNEDICGAGGTSRLYAVDYLTGLQARKGSNTVLKDDDGNNLPNDGQRHDEDDDGLPSDPVFHYDRTARAPKLLIQKSDTTVDEEDIDMNLRPMAIQSWQASEGN